MIRSRLLSVLLSGLLLVGCATAYPPPAKAASTYSYDLYTGNGSTTAYSISYPYLKQGDISVSVGGVAKVAGTDYIFTSPSVITFTAAPSNGAQVVIHRTTNLVVPQSVWNGGPILSSSLNNEVDQLLYLIQETSDTTVHASPQDTGPLVLPSPATRANLYLGFDGNGNPIAEAGGGGGGGGAISSVFGRTGTITASSGDYTCAQVTNCPDYSTPTVLNVASTMNLGAATSSAVTITGTTDGRTQVTSFGTAPIGVTKRVKVAGGQFGMTFNATSMQLPNSGQNMGVQTGDTFTATSLGSGNWKVSDFTPYAACAWLENLPQNSPLYPWTLQCGNDLGTAYPDFGLAGNYSAPHTQMKAQLLAIAGDYAKVWVFADGGTSASPTPLTQMQWGYDVMLWPLDNTGGRFADQTVEGGRAEFQGRAAQFKLWQDYPQTPTSRPGAASIEVTPPGWQAPVGRFWIDSRGGVVLEGKAPEDAVNASVIPYPWNNCCWWNSNAPAPNINIHDYVSQANETLIMSDASSNAIEDWLREDALWSANTRTGFRWQYSEGTGSGGALQLQRLNTGSATLNMQIDQVTGAWYIQGDLTVSGTIHPGGNTPSVASSCGTGSTIAGYDNAAQVALGSSVTSCTITWSKTESFVSCVVTPKANTPSYDVNGFGSATLKVDFPSGYNGVFYYICM